MESCFFNVAGKIRPVTTQRHVNLSFTIGLDPTCPTYHS